MRLEDRRIPVFFERDPAAVASAKRGVALVVDGAAGMDRDRVAEAGAGDGERSGVEWSTTLEPGSWKELPDSGVGTYHEFRVPVGAHPRTFLRLKVAIE